MKKTIILAIIAISGIQALANESPEKKTKEVTQKAEQLSCEQLARKLNGHNKHIYIQRCL